MVYYWALRQVPGGGALFITNLTFDQFVFYSREWSGTKYPVIKSGSFVFGHAFC